MDINEFIDIDLGCHAKGSIITSDEAATWAENYGSSAFQLGVVLALEDVNYGLGILGCDGNIIHVYGDVFIDIVFVSHPDIRLCLTWLETHVSETISQMFMPPEARGTETIEGLDNDKGVAFQFAKFQAGDHKDLLLGFCFQVGIPDVSCPDV